MKLQQLMSYTRRAVDDYQLIENNDHIAIGISGGKDSLSLLHSLAGLRRFYPNKFTLSAIMVNLGLVEWIYLKSVHYAGSWKCRSMK